MTATVFARRVSSLYIQLRLDLSIRVRKWTPRHERTSDEHLSRNTKKSFNELSVRREDTAT